MQAAAATYPLLRFNPSKSFSPPLRLRSTALIQATSLCPPIKATAPENDNLTVDYSSMTTSVFPAEACETVGGEACGVEMYPEVKLQQAESKTNTPSETIEREYLNYDNPKTVFLDEACDDLGGEFCEPEKQSGVH